MDARRLSEWLIGEALSGSGDFALFHGYCERLVAAGVPLFRGFMASDVLHPTVESRAVRWQRGTDTVSRTAQRRPGATDDAVGWLTSPFHAMLQDGRNEMRVDLTDAALRERFPICGEVHAEGGVDYAAFMVPFGGILRFGTVEEMFASFATDRPDGFRDQELAMIRDTIRTFGLGLHTQRMAIAGRTLLGTYLGADAADRVLRGNIERGRAEPVQAAIWSSDLTDFTRISDTAAPEDLLALLNAYAEIAVGLIEEEGGTVLKFVGDGLLAIFRDDDVAAACARALAAARRLPGAVAALNARRQAAGQPTTSATLALHVGELLYGNFGGPRRLDFTVLGPAVNEASRINALSRTLDQRLIVSAAFAQTLPASDRGGLVSLGRYALRGVARPAELFTLDPDAS